MTNSSGTLQWDQITSEYVSDQQNNSFNWGGTSTGSANAQTIALSPAITTYQAGQIFEFKAGFTNTNATVLNAGAGSKNLYKQGVAGPIALTGGEIVTGQTYTVIYDGTQFVLQSIPVSIPTPQTALLYAQTTQTTDNYTAGSGDSHKLFNLNASAAGNKTFTVPAASGLPSDFSIGVCNRDSATWNFTSADAGTVKLYPGQCNGMALDSTRTKMAFLQPFQRYYFSSATLYVGVTSCSDTTNDGLAQSRPFCTIQKAINTFVNDIDLAGGTGTIQLQADGRTYTECIEHNGFATGGGDQLHIIGNSLAPTNAVLMGCGTAGTPVATAEDGGILTLDSVEIACNNGPGAFARQNGVVDVTNVVLGSCTGQNMLDAENGGNVNVTGNLSVQGNAAAVVYASGGGAQIIIGSVTVTVGTFNWSNAFAVATNLGQVIAQTVTWNISAPTGKRFSGLNLGDINTNGSCTTGSPGTSTYFPGSVAGTLTNSAVCE